MLWSTVYSTELGNIVLVLLDFTIVKNQTLHKNYCFSVSGGMVMDPFRSGGMGSMGGDMFRPPHNPGQLPRLVFSILSYCRT